MSWSNLLHTYLISSLFKHGNGHHCNEKSKKTEQSFSCYPHSKRTSLKMSFFCNQVCVGIRGRDPSCASRSAAWFCKRRRRFSFNNNRQVPARRDLFYYIVCCSGAGLPGSSFKTGCLSQDGVLKKSYCHLVDIHNTGIQFLISLGR